MTNADIPRKLKLFAAIAGAIVVGASAWGILSDPVTTMFDLQTRSAAAAEHESIRHMCGARDNEILIILKRIDSKMEDF